jgi:hypothetical protein
MQYNHQRPHEGPRIPNERHVNGAEIDEDHGLLPTGPNDHESHSTRRFDGNRRFNDEDDKLKIGIINACIIFSRNLKDDKDKNKQAKHLLHKTLEAIHSSRDFHIVMNAVPFFLRHEQNAAEFIEFMKQNLPDRLKQHLRSCMDTPSEQPHIASLLESMHSRITRLETKFSY